MPNGALHHSANTAGNGMTRERPNYTIHTYLYMYNTIRYTETMCAYTHLYIDFDGVICDSVQEAFVSSYAAYYDNLELARKVVADTTASVNAIQDTFYQYRPFIRSGQHFMLLQHCIAHGIVLTSQSDFERELQATSAAQLAEWRRILYDMRALFIKEHVNEFLSIHHFYDHVYTHLMRLSKASQVIILSTKKEHLVSLLLSHAHIDWPSDRIVGAHTQSKIDIIKNRHLNTQEQVAFIDDHLPHTLSIAHGRKYGIDCYLADWGYMLPQWREDARYAHLNTHTLPSFLALFM